VWVMEPGELLRPPRDRWFEQRAGGELGAEAQDLDPSRFAIGQLDAIAEAVEETRDRGSCVSYGRLLRSHKRSPIGSTL
jgi:hypothetical protein